MTRRVPPAVTSVPMANIRWSRNSCCRPGTHSSQERAPHLLAGVTLLRFCWFSLPSVRDRLSAKSLAVSAPSVPVLSAPLW